jgi:BirA family biotin operon repressor/biotin-[acetyl-CoA-carboxylase] ligase
MTGVREEMVLAGWPVHWHACVTSTNDVARALTPDDTRAVIVADEQTAGRGQQGRRWESPPGANLLCSLRLPTAALRTAELVSLGAGIAVCRVLCEHHLDAQCKWPNDVQVGGAKIAGILVEQTSVTTVVGIGLNVHWPAARQAGDSGAIWTSLRAETGIDGDRRRLLEELLIAWNACMPADAGLLLAGYRRCWHKPARVQVRCGEAWQPAAVCDITGNGTLAVQLDNGRVCTVASSAQLSYS